jgi:anti-sigma factor RsiW
MHAPEERTIGGISCFGVLAKLSDYLDGALEAEEIGQINAHIVGCDQCRRFGAAFQEIIGRLRADLREAEPLDPQVRGRLRTRLRAASH